MTKRGKGWRWRLWSGSGGRKKSPPVGAWAGGLWLAVNPSYGKLFSFDFCHNVVNVHVSVKNCDLNKVRMAFKALARLVKITIVLLFSFGAVVVAVFAHLINLRCHLGA